MERMRCPPVFLSDTTMAPEVEGRWLALLVRGSCSRSRVRATVDGKGRCRMDGTPNPDELSRAGDVEGREVRWRCVTDDMVRRERAACPSTPYVCVHRMNARTPVSYEPFGLSLVAGTQPHASADSAASVLSAKVSSCRAVRQQ